MKKIIISKDILIKKYVKQQKSVNLIAKELKCSSSIVKRNIHKYKISMRDRHTCKLIKNNKYYSIFSKELLIKLYLKEYKEIKQIADIYNCNGGTVKKYLLFYHIPIRNLSSIKKKWWKENKHRILFVGHEHTEQTKEKLRKLRLGKLLKEMGHKEDCSCSFCGNHDKENNPNWKNGKSFEPYPLGWNKTFKEQIRYRDDYKCKLCGVPEVECNRKLDVHHKDYNKKNLNPKNLISLCQSCHGKTNGDREYWLKYFQNKLINTIN